MNQCELQTYFSSLFSESFCLRSTYKSVALGLGFVELGFEILSTYFHETNNKIINSVWPLEPESLLLFSGRSRLITDLNSGVRMCAG